MKRCEALALCLASLAVGTWWSMVPDSPLRWLLLLGMFLLGTWASDIDEKLRRG